MGIFGKMVNQISDSIETISSIELNENTPKLPTLFGNQFKIAITPTDGRHYYSNLIQQIYDSRIQKIDAIKPIAIFLDFYFKKMNNDLQAQTVENLMIDYGGEENGDHILFSLNKLQIFEFLDLVKKASKGLEI